MWHRSIAYTGMAGTAACGILMRMAKASQRRGIVPPNTQYRYAAPPTREDMLVRMKDETFDVVVIGGGATGCGVAMEAASRGLKCALLEREDFGCGTSSRSTKLIHGGIRYLENAMKHFDVGEFKLLCEALQERAHLMTAAPYMASPIPILMPVYKIWEIPMFWVGVKMYDWIGKVVSGGHPGLPNCFWISKSNSRFFFPLLKHQKLKGSIVYYDGQMNDARLNLQLALTSTLNDYLPGMTGACIANHCSVLDLKSNVGKMNEVEVKDNLSGETFSMKASTIVNCTGPFSDSIRQKGSKMHKIQNLVTSASGVHITLPSFYSSMPFGMIIPQTTDGRVLYYLPWEGHTIVGTTDQPAAPSALPRATREEIDFIVKESCRYLSLKDEALRKNITATWSGLRPLVADPKKPESSRLSRTHEIVVERNGMLSVLGGKWTTYRRMAEDAVDKLYELYGHKLSCYRKCHSRYLLLSNAIDPSREYLTSDCCWTSGKLPFDLVDKYNISMSQARHLVRNYGFRAVDLCEMGKSLNLMQPLVSGHPFLRAEVVYSIDNEMARTPSDVLGRRLRLAFVDQKAAEAALPEVIKMMRHKLEWTTRTEIEMQNEASEFLKSMGCGI